MGRPPGRGWEVMARKLVLTTTDPTKCRFHGQGQQHLYADLGSSASDARSLGTTVPVALPWTKIGGDGINSGWAVNTYEEVDMCDWLCPAPSMLSGGTHGQ